MDYESIYHNLLYSIVFYINEQGKKERRSIEELMLDSRVKSIDTLEFCNTI
jgi:hypothetical protein